MGNTESNLKILEGFCGFDAFISAVSTPCEPSDDEEYLKLHKKAREETDCQLKEQNRKLAEVPDIYYGSN